MGQEQVKQLLPLIADENGKVSEEAFMNYMLAEFRELNKDERGQVNALELTNRPRRSVTFSSFGK
jgi:hypothetical protein